nr:hypothetical protein [uncultured Blautia sp.]
MKCYTNVVTATFKNVKKGTYYAGLRAFNRTSEEGKKVFSQRCVEGSDHRK